MLYYLVICFFVVGSVDLKHKVLDLPSSYDASIGDIQNASASPHFNQFLIGDNENESALLSELLNVSPQDVHKVILLVKELIAQANKEIATLNSELDNAAKNEVAKKKADDSAQIVVDNAAKNVKAKQEALKRAQTAHQSAKDAKAKIGKDLDAAQKRHRDLKERVRLEKPVLENQVNVLKKVLALLVPMGPAIAPAPKKNQVFKTFKQVSKTFNVSMDVYINDFKKEGWFNVFHMTTGNDGSRVPAIWVYISKNNRLIYFCNSVSGNQNYCLEYKNISPKKWYHIEVSQIKQDKKYMYSVSVNSKVLSTVENTQPRADKNVTAYVTNPWYNALNGRIENVRIITPA